MAVDGSTWPVGRWSGQVVAVLGGAEPMPGMPVVAPASVAIPELSRPVRLLALSTVGRFAVVSGSLWCRWGSSATAAATKPTAMMASPRRAARRVDRFELAG